MNKPQLQPPCVSSIPSFHTVNNIWTFGSFACGCICSFFAYIYLHQVRPSYIADNSNYYSVILLYAFLVGFQITHSLGYVALSSGVSTIFVA